MTNPTDFCAITEAGREAISQTSHKPTMPAVNLTILARALATLGGAFEPLFELRL